MKDNILLVIALITCVVIIFCTPKEEGRWYDCRISEISPDYPQEVKEQCRKLRIEQIKPVGTTV